jgi:hypothetical protein
MASASPVCVTVDGEILQAHTVRKDAACRGTRIVLADGVVALADGTRTDDGMGVGATGTASLNVSGVPVKTSATF